MQRTLVRTHRPRARGWWIPWTFVGGFAVVIAANGAMLYFATSTFSGLTTQHAYVEGLAYNDRVAEEDAQEALGWALDLTLADDASASPPSTPDEHVMPVRLTARDADSRPLDGLSVAAQVRRPAEPGFDQTVTLAPVGPGLYGATLALPKPGQWELLVTASRGDDTYRLRRRLRAD